MQVLVPDIQESSSTCRSSEVSGLDGSEGFAVFAGFRAYGLMFSLGYTTLAEKLAEKLILNPKQWLACFGGSCCRHLVESHLI